MAITISAPCEYLAPPGQLGPINASDEVAEIVVPRASRSEPRYSKRAKACGRDHELAPAGPPSRSSSSATVIFCAIPVSLYAIAQLHRTRSTL
jgi:hypothetical protein